MILGAHRAAIVSSGSSDRWSDRFADVGAPRLDALLPLTLHLAVLLIVQKEKENLALGIRFFKFRLRTLQLQLMQRISPHGWMRGCHSSPFSNTSPLNRHPPAERRSASPRTTASSSAVSLGSRSTAAEGGGAGVDAGHCLQQAMGSGRKASLSLQLRAGQVNLVHSTFNVSG